MTERQVSGIEIGSEVEYFRIIRLLGRGGMGEVYLALDTRLGRKVALKMILPTRLQKPSAHAQFLSEARATARFNHPHIVTIHAVGVYEDRPFLALEYLEGETLRARLSTEAPGFRAALRVASAIAQGLEEAHAHDILHRDLKPANVFLSQDGRIRVLDFGLACAVSDSGIADGADGTATTEAGGAMGATESGDALVGTPAYLAPEQWLQGDGSKASDVWSFGLLFYELLCGTHPYAGLGVWDLRYQVTQPLPVPPVETRAEVPDTIAALVGQCLDKAPEKRPSFGQIVQSLALLLSPGQMPLRLEQSPFCGMQPFTEAEAPFFFGREGQIAAFVERLRVQPLIPVVGPSGAGKSSFLRAGVLPRLREQERWHVMVMRPGRTPFATLALRLMTSPSALGQSSGERLQRASEGAELLATQLQAQPSLLSLRLFELASFTGCRSLLVVDQLEELFTMVDDDEVRQSFLAALCAAANDPRDPIRILTSVRDDFLWRFASSPVAREPMSRVWALPPLAKEALLESLCKPVQSVGYEFDDPDLPVRMVADVRKEESSDEAALRVALPLLQFAAQMLWERRDVEGKRLRLASYEEIGGVPGALAAHAEEVLRGLTRAQLQEAKALLLRLVHPTGTRRALSMDEALGGLGETAADVLEQLIQKRLVVVRKSRGREGEAETYVELVHESLVHTWKELVAWREESREEHAFGVEVQDATALWTERGRRKEELWREEAWLEAQRMRPRLLHTTEQIEQFLDACAAEDARTKALGQRRQRTFFALAVAVVVASLLGLSFFFVEKQRADVQRKEAQRQLAQSLAEGAQSALTQRFFLVARAKARSALEQMDTPTVRELWQRIKHHQLLYYKNMRAAVYQTDMTPDGRTVAAGTQHGGAYLVDTRTLKLRLLPGHRSQVTAISFSPGSRWLATGTNLGELRIWSVATGRLLRKYRAHTNRITSLVWRPGVPHPSVVSVSLDKRAYLWEPLTGHKRALYGPHQPLSLAVMGPYARHFVAADTSGGIWLWALQTREQATLLRGHRKDVAAMVFTKDGQTLVSASRDGIVRRWNLRTQKSQVWQRLSLGKKVYAMAFSDDMRALAIGHTGHIRVWSLHQRRWLHHFRGKFFQVSSLQFAPGQRFLVSGGWEGLLWFWNVQHAKPAPKRSGHISQGTGVLFHPNGREILSSSWDGTIRVWSRGLGRPQQTWRGHKGGVLSIALARKHRLVASAGWDRQILLWSLGQGRIVRRLQGHKVPVEKVLWSPDETLLASLGQDHSLYLWSMPKGVLTARLVYPEHKPKRIAFSPNGRWLVSVGARRVVLWDVQARKVMRTWAGLTGVRAIVFSPDSASLYVSDHLNSLGRWTLATGAYKRLARHKAPTNALAMHPSGRWLAAGYSDGTLRIWQLKGMHVRVLPGHFREINALRFDVSGRFLLSTGDDRTVRLWDVPSGRAMWHAPFYDPRQGRLYKQPHQVSRTKSHPGAQRKKARYQTSWEERVSHAWLADQASGHLLCLVTFGREVELWDRRSDRRLWQQRWSGIVEVAAARGGCVVRVAHKVWALSLRGGKRLLHSKARFLTSVQGGVVVGTKSEALVYQAPRVQGHKRSVLQQWRRCSIQGDVTAALVHRGKLFVGFESGAARVYHLHPKCRADASVSLHPSFSNPIVRLLHGPMDSLIAGYAHGYIAQWSLRSGKNIMRDWQLNGPVVHLSLSGHTLFAASSAGFQTVLDMRALSMPRCQFLRGVWRQVPVVWEGRVKARARPAQHPCANQGHPAQTHQP